jgi:hypothetical protein
MDTAELIVNVIFWSAGLSMGSLGVLLALDWLESRRTQYTAGVVARARHASVSVVRLQQPVAQRRRPAEIDANVTAKAA